MNLFKYFIRQQKQEVAIGGKSMDQIRKEHDIRMRREQMRRFPERFVNNYQLSFE